MIEAIQQRLADWPGSDWSRVGSALNLASALEKRPSTGAELYVVPVAERPGQNRRGGGQVLQEIVVTFGVVTAIRAINDPDGARSREQLEVVRQQIRAAIFGWIPPGAQTAVLLANSDLVQVQPGAIWWVDRFTTTTMEASNG